MRAFFHDAKSAKIAVIMQFAAFGQAVFRESVANFAWRTQIRGQDSDDAENNNRKKGPPILPDGNGGKSDAGESETEIPESVAIAHDIFFGFPRDVFYCLCHK